MLNTDLERISGGRSEYLSVKGFTLAEVLITLGIIGIVAAMTLPSIIQKRNDKEAVVKLKKMYSVMENAYRLAILEHGSPDTWSDIPAETPTAFADKLEPYIKVVHRYKKSYRYNFVSVKSPVSISESPKAIFKLADGSEFVFKNSYSTGADNAACKANAGTNLAECIWLYFDINGIDNQPNRLGEDMFTFVLTKDGVRPVGMSGYWGFNTCRPDKSGDQGVGYGCTAYALVHESRDYLKCKTGNESACKLRY